MHNIYKKQSLLKQSSLFLHENVDFGHFCYLSKF